MLDIMFINKMNKNVVEKNWNIAKNFYLFKLFFYVFSLIPLIFQAVKYYNLFLQIPIYLIYIFGIIMILFWYFYNTYLMNRYKVMNKKIKSFNFFWMLSTTIVFATYMSLMLFVFVVGVLDDYLLFRVSTTTFASCLVLDTILIISGFKYFFKNKCFSIN